jgi:poly-gamma-glutamate synthesis protein (capsule biosynthesis protein)
MKFCYYSFLFIFLVGCQNPLKKENIKHLQLEQPISQKKIVEIEKSDMITLGFVGDVILHERLRKREIKTKEGYAVIWSAIQNYIEKPDITYANLEGPVAPELGGVSGFPMFNYPEKIIPALKDNGFDLVSTANNHALDRRANGIRKTIQNLKK